MCEGYAEGVVMLGIFKKLMNALSCDIGIDLGTANTLVFIKGQGVVIREPSVVAMQQGTKKILAVGAEAKRMLGRTPGNIVAVRPMKSGVIADFDITEAMIRYFIAKARGHKLVKPRVVVAVAVGHVGEADVEIQPRQPVGVLAGDGVGQALRGERRERGVERRSVAAQIQERGHRHVAADAAGAVEIKQVSHDWPSVAPGAGYGRPSRPRRSRCRCSPRRDPPRRR